MSDNNVIQNEEEQPNKTPGKKDSIFSRIRMELSEAQVKKYRKFILGVAAISSGIFAFCDGFGRWWFGFRPGAWVAITIAIALNVVWLMAVCGYMSESPEKKIKVSLNALLMIALPALVLGIILGSITLHWRNTEKIVILVESFDGVGKDPYYVAKAVKSQLERSIRLLDRHRITVVLGKQYDRESRKDIPLDERALKYRADMVISGWYTEMNSEPPEGDSEILFTANFYVVRVPQSLPAIFRRHEESYPKTLIFSRKEIENFTVHSTLASLLEYEFVLMIGAGAYAAGDWKTAEYYFGEALERIKQSEKEALEKSKATEQKSLKSRQKRVYSEERIAGDKAMLTLYLGNCLLNQRQLDLAIGHFHEAVRLAREVSAIDISYDYIVSHALLNRGIAYREKNAFELAARDFGEAEKFSPLTDGIRRRRLEEPRSYSRQVLQTSAGGYLNRGEKYIQNRDGAYAGVELKTAVEMYRELRQEAIDPNRQIDYSILLARSLLGLGKSHLRLALPQLKDDKHTEQAVSCLNESYDITKELENKGISEPKSVRELSADCLRHLGEAYRAQDQNDVVEKAIGYHEEARDIWLKFKEDPNTSEKEQARIASIIAGELTRIGNVYRKLDDLEHPRTDPNRRRQELTKKAIKSYEDAVKMWMDENKSEILLSDSFGSESDITKAVENKTAHHLAFSLLNLADAYINQPDPNEQDIALSCRLLIFASDCYESAHKMLDIDKDREWIEKLRHEEYNYSLTDDLAWCLTLYGYALTRKACKDPNSIEIYKQANEKLEDARDYYHEQLPVKDYSNLVLNLFALSLTEHKLDTHQHSLKAIETFHEACLTLRDLTRNEKKVWYVDHVCEILDELRSDDKFWSDVKKSNKEDFKDIRNWLISDTVRAGRSALDRIIDDAEEIINKGTWN